MLALDNYHSENLLYKTSVYHLFSGFNNYTGEPVLIKYFPISMMENVSIKRHLKDYETLKEHKNKYYPEVYDINYINAGDYNGTIIIYENIDGVTFKDFFQKNNDIKLFLYYTLDLLAAIDFIHKHNILLKNIFPGRIVIDRQKNKGRIKDLGIFKKIYTEDLKRNDDFLIQNILPYISPEQTGRMDATVDYRADFYSLGLCLYEILSGNKAFDTEDILELIHSHLAISPDFKIFFNNKEIPGKISEIIYKMISKDPDDRYQSSYGLKKDFERCLKDLEQKGSIDDFIPGEKDSFEKLNISNCFYGRDLELKGVLKSYENVVNGNSELLLISGSAGEGKSTLAFEAAKILKNNGTKTIYGKYDHIQRNSPYSAILTALRNLIKKYLILEYEEILEFKKEIISTLGENTQIIIDLIPEVKYITGKQVPIKKMPVAETGNRFNHVLLEFIKIFINEKFPLVIFLDDLQWIDLESVNLIKNMYSKLENNKFFIMGTYRQNEIYSAHPILDLIAFIKKQHVKVTELKLFPLSKDAVKNIIENTFGSINSDDDLFLNEVYRKTGGNPFFISQFLSSLYHENIIEYDYEKGIWNWRKEKIKSDSYGKDIAEFMSIRLKKLSKEIKNVLQIASCIGNRFNLKLLSDIMKESCESVSLLLGQAIKEGLIITDDLNESNKDNFLLVNKEIYFIFIHDRVQQAVNLLIPDERIKEINYEIFKVLLNKYESSENINIFDLVNHSNIAVDILDYNEKLKLAKLNYEAADKAKSSVAYELSYEYLQIAKNLLADSLWKTDYGFMLDVYIALTESASLTSNFEKMHYYADYVINNCKNEFDESRVFEIIISAYISNNKLDLAIDEFYKISAKLGIKLKKDINKKNLFFEYIKTTFKKIKKNFKSFPAVDKLNKYSIFLRLLILIAASSYFKSLKLFIYLTLKSINYINRSGNIGELAFSYNCYMLLLLKQNKIKKAYHYYSIIKSISEKISGKRFDSKINFLSIYFLLFRFKSPDECKDLMYKNYEDSLKSGDFEYAAYSLSTYNIFLFFTGKPLKEQKEIILTHYGKMNYLKQQRITNMLDLYLTNIEALLGNRDFIDIDTKFTDERSIFVYNSFKLIYLYLCNRIDEALTLVSFFEKTEPGIPTVLYPEVIFYISLIKIDLYYKSDNRSKTRVLKEIKKNQKILKAYVNDNEKIFYNKCLLIEAEIKGCLGKNKDAITLFEKALLLTTKKDFPLEEALINERIAIYYKRIFKSKIADIFFKSAYLLYDKWGCDIKKNYLIINHPTIIDSNQIVEYENKINKNKDNTLDSLDLESVIKMSQTISGEIVLEKLLRNLMNILIENAGAEKGYFIRVRKKGLYVEAEVKLDGSKKKIKNLNSLKLEDYSEIPGSVVNYVHRTFETVMLNDAYRDVNFREDEVIKSNKIHSILCFPLINNNETKGIIYLENSRTSNAFKYERVEAIKMFSVQAAISLENAFLFEKTKEAEKEKDRQFEEIQAQYEELEVMNEELLKTTNELISSNENFAIFKKFSEESSQAFVMSDLKGNITYCNGAFADLICIEEQKNIIGTNIFSYYPEIIGENLTEMITELHSGVANWYCEMPMTDSNGVIVPTIQNCFIIKDNYKRPQYIANVITDITDQKNFEDELQGTKYFLENIFNSLKSILISINGDFRITKWNISAKKYTGQSEIDVINKPVWIALPFLTDFKDKIEEVILNKKANNINRVKVTFETTKYFNISINPLKLKNGYGAVITLNDITDMVKNEEQLIQAQKMDLIGNLAGGLAHDFNNLLGGIVGTVSLLKHFSKQEILDFSKIEKGLNTIENASNRAADLVKKLLTMSRKNEKETKDMDLLDSINNVLDICKGTFFKSIKIVKNLPAGRNVMIYADKTQIEQVLLNICINASHSMTVMRENSDLYGGVLTISIDKIIAEELLCEDQPMAQLGSNYWKVEIKDTGVGIDEDIIDKIFDPFFTTKNKTGGSGLGLSMVYNIVKDHDGFIGFSSIKGKGSTFSVYLPAKDYNSNYQSDDNYDKLLWGYGSILIIDDEEVIRKTAGAILIECGFNVLYAVDGFEGIDLYKQYMDDIVLVVLDMAMPGISGKETYIQVKKINPFVKVLLASGYKQDIRVKETLELGVNDFIQKPYSMSELCKKINSVLEPN